MSKEMILGEQWFVCTNCRRPFTPTSKLGYLEDPPNTVMIGNMYYCKTYNHNTQTCVQGAQISPVNGFQP